MLTQQQKRYAEGRAAGLIKKAAAIAAGCPEASASQAASRYEKNADVQAHMLRLGFTPDAKLVVRGEPEPYRELPTAAEAAQENIEKRSEIKPKSLYDCPLDYMRDLVNDPIEDPKLRLDAAKAWASYVVPKVGDKGKKEERQAAAERVAGSSRFGMQAPPLKAVK